MADIFISYATEDRKRVIPIVKALKKQGRSVFWDSESIPVGKKWRHFIKEGLDEARCVLVLWSRESIDSDWVIDEAEYGKDKHKLLPALIDEVRPPLGFGQIQAAPLLDWSGESTHPGFQQLLGALGGLLEAPRVQVPTREPSEAEARRPEPTIASEIPISARPSNSEYRKLFETLVLVDKRKGIIDDCRTRLAQGRSRYEKVSIVTGVPWFLVGIFHQLECRSFNVHLHNGDPLNARTVHVPIGRPLSGLPPFTWEESAVDTLRYRHMNEVTDWTIEAFLYQLEVTNGMGYRMHGVHSPYLWGGSNHYSKGRYVADGSFDPEAVSRIIGGAIQLKFAVPKTELKKLQAPRPTNKD
jgi:lysozyme family protein